MSQLIGRSPHSVDPSVLPPAKGLVGVSAEVARNLCRVLAEHGGHGPTVVSSKTCQGIEPLSMCPLKDVSQQE